MKRQAFDTLTRANQSGLGSGTDNQPWSKVSGTMTGDIASNKGHLVGTTDTYWRYGSAVARDVKARVRFKCTDHVNDVFGIAVRAVDGANLYRPRAMNGTVQITKFIAGALTVIASTAFALINGQDYWMVYFVRDHLHTVKVWADGTTEPSSWTVTTTDTTYLDSGGFGIQAWTGNGAHAIDFDNFMVVPFPIRRSGIL